MKHLLLFLIASLALVLSSCDLLTMPTVPDSSKAPKSMFTKYGTGDLNEIPLFEAGQRLGVKISGTVSNAAALMSLTSPLSLAVGTPISFVVNVPGPIGGANGNIDITISPDPSSYNPSTTKSIMVRIGPPLQVFIWTNGAPASAGTGSGAVDAKDITVTLNPTSTTNIDVTIGGSGITFTTLNLAVAPSVFSAGAYLVFSHDNSTKDVILKSINGNPCPLVLE